MPVNGSTVEEFKRAAGYAAVDTFVRPDTCIGLGTGTTALWAIERAGELIAAGTPLRAVATSKSTEDLCRARSIPLRDLMDEPIDVAIDGADEVAADGSLTKGGGGALFREKAVALAARRFIVVVSEEKIVYRLGQFATPVEVVPFALAYVLQRLARLPQPPVVRRRMAADHAAPYVTDNGNALLDCEFGSIADPALLAAHVLALHGVVDVGLFVGLTDAVMVAGSGGVRRLDFARPAAED
jgi:ribose 5-phosphate isomerase A